LPDPPKYLVELAREKKKLEEIRNLSNSRNNNDNEKHLALTLEAYKKCMTEVDKMHMKAVIELKTLLSKNEKLAKFTAK
jgi:hypothetical protein